MEAYTTWPVLSYKISYLNTVKTCERVKSNVFFYISTRRRAY